jgi:cytochrome P450
MILFPHVQARAQAEIDAAIGRDRLPTLADRDQLPYVCALINEIMRFSLVVPQPTRLCRSDDFYGEYFIPKGSFVILNTWYIAWSPS